MPRHEESASVERSREQTTTTHLTGRRCMQGRAEILRSSFDFEHFYQGMPEDELLRHHPPEQTSQRASELEPRRVPLNPSSTKPESCATCSGIRGFTGPALKSLRLRFK